MQRDYYSFRCEEMNGILDKIEQLIIEQEQAREEKKKDAQKRAVGEVAREAKSAVGIEPHLAYLWFSARKGEADEADNKPLAKREAAALIRSAWQNRLASSIQPIPDAFRFVPDVENQVLDYLPLLSFIIHIPFRLNKPYLSKDDCEFYILENPVKKEWVFKVPYIAPSQWKGALRSAMVRQLVTDLYSTGDEGAFFQKRLQLYRVFGHEKDGTAEYLNRVLAKRRVGPEPQNKTGEQEEWRRQFDEELQKVEGEFEATLRKQGYLTDDVEGFQGCTYFFPTFFDKIGLEVINPHDRQSGAGSQPIHFECVPQGTPGTFVLIYVPFNSTGHDDAKRRQEVAEDLETLARGVCAMLTTYGFGAKTSSGYGVAEDKLANTGILAIRVALPGITTSAVPTTEPISKPDLPRYLESPTCLHPDFRREDGSLKSENEYRTLVESRGQEYGKKQKQLYEKARKWWEHRGKALWEESGAQSEGEAESQEILTVVKRTFETLSELQAVAQEVADALRKEEGA